MNRVARTIWRLLGPLRRPIARKLSALVRGSVGEVIRESIHPPLGELLVGVATARREVGTYRNETNLVLDSLVREVTRLQDEVAALRVEMAGADYRSTIPMAQRDPLAESA